MSDIRSTRELKAKRYASSEVKIAATAIMNILAISKTIGLIEGIAVIVVVYYSSEPIDNALSAIVCLLICCISLVFFIISTYSVEYYGN